MKPTPHICADHREDFLAEGARAAGLEQHASECGACHEWLARRSWVVGLLGSLDRHVAPVELDQALSGNLEAGQSVLSRDLFDLERLTAPDELEARVAADLVEAPTWTRLLRELPAQGAPHVLERLVSEELADPSAAITRRFAGGLPHKLSPDSLERGLEEDLGAVPAPRQWWKPVGSLAAAAVLAWAMIPFGAEPGGADSPRFRLIEVQSFASMDSMARPLVLGLAGSRVESPVNLGSAR